ncbi:MAG: serine hydrolase domain-containing protein [Pseudomonadales bacterium]
MTISFRHACRLAVLPALLLIGFEAAAAPSDARVLASARPESVGMSSQRLDRIGPAMQRYIDAGLVPGTITAIMRRGKLVHFEVRGSMDAEAGVPMREDTIFRIASMTKPITSVALMMLWERGLFQLRDPVSAYLPEFADMQVSTTADSSGATGELVPTARPMQVRDLLTHTAGLANNYIGNTAHYRSVMEARPEDDLESYIARLASLPLNYHPGTEWQYSGATDVVGRLVEVLSGKALDVFFAEEIFEPLGMRDTHFYLDEAKAPRLAAQYKPGDDQRIVLEDAAGAASRWVTGPKTLFRGAGGLASTTRDYLRFQQMMLNGGELGGVRLLAPATVSLMLENHTGELPLWLAGPGMGFGLGYGVVTDRGAAATPLSLGAAYWGGAYCTLSWLDPEQELVAVVMTQVRPYTHINIRQDFQVLTYQAIVD